MPTEVEDFYGDPRRTSAYPTRAQLNEAIDALRDGIAAEQTATEAAQSATTAAENATSAAQTATKAAETLTAVAVEAKDVTVEAKDVVVAAEEVVVGIKDELTDALEEAAGVADEVDELQADGRFEKWTGTVDSIDKVTDDMIGAKKLESGNYPRLHARNKEIHACKGFSNETGSYTGQELLLPWEVAMTNETSYLMAGVKFKSNRGMGGETPFVQPLLPEGYIPNFEYSPLYWIGHILYNDAQDPSQSAVKQVSLDWTKVPAGGQGTIALTSDVEEVEELAENAVKKTAGTTYLNWHEKTYTNDSSIGTFAFYPAPVGFLLRQQMKNPYGSFYLYWMKPNGERVLLHTAQDAWLKAGASWRFGWLDGNSAKVAVYVSASQSAIVEVPFVDGVAQAPSATLVAGGSLPYASICATAKKLTNGHILTSVGRVYNPSTLELTSTITLKYPRIVSATDGGVGVFATLSDAVYRLDDDENGAIVQTKTSTSAVGLALSDGQSVEAILSSGNFAVAGGRTQSGYRYFFTNESIRFPIFVDIDLGSYLLSPYGIFAMAICGGSTDSIAYPQTQILSREAINSSTNGTPIVSGDGSVAVFNTAYYTIYSAEELV